MRRGGVALVLVGLLVAGVVASCGARVDVGVDGVSTRWIRVAAPQPRRALLVTDADRSPSDSDGLPLVLVLHGLRPNAELMAPPEASSALGWRLSSPVFQELRAHPAVVGVQLETKRLELKQDRRWARRG